MTAERPRTVLLGRHGGPRMLGYRGVCRVQVFAVNFLLLLSAAVFGARAEKDFSMVSHRSHSATPDPLGLSVSACPLVAGY